jgi:hypothetical protein
MGCRVGMLVVCSLLGLLPRCALQTKDFFLLRSNSLLYTITSICTFTSEHQSITNQTSINQYIHQSILLQTSPCLSPFPPIPPLPSAAASARTKHPSRNSSKSTSVAERRSSLSAPPAAYVNSFLSSLVYCVTAFSILILTYCLAHSSSRREEAARQEEGRRSRRL